MLKANPTYDTTGRVVRVAMDGSGLEEIPGLAGSHHDFAVLPGGITAFMIWADQGPETSDLVERSPDGTFHTVAALDPGGLRTTAGNFHANALRYYASDDTYTVSDLSQIAVTRLNRQGEVLWQARGACPDEYKSECAPVTLYGVHGHELLANGNLLYFEAHNGNPAPIHGPSPIHEYSFGVGAGGALTATLEWTYVEDEADSFVLGDVHRLPSGNTLVTYGSGRNGTIHEVTPESELAQTLTVSGELGYTSFRKTLYGPPQ
jgi:hypothetical protein